MEKDNNLVPLTIIQSWVFYPLLTVIVAMQLFVTQFIIDMVIKYIPGTIFEYKIYGTTFGAIAVSVLTGVFMVMAVLLKNKILKFATNKWNTIFNNYKSTTQNINDKLKPIYIHMDYTIKTYYTSKGKIPSPRDVKDILNSYINKLDEDLSILYKLGEYTPNNSAELYDELKDKFIQKYT